MVFFDDNDKMGVEKKEKKSVKMVGGEEREAQLEKERRQGEEMEKQMIVKREEKRRKRRVVSEKQKQFGIEFLRRVFGDDNKKVLALTTENFASQLCDGLSMDFFFFFLLSFFFSFSLLFFLCFFFFFVCVWIKILSLFSPIAFLSPFSHPSSKSPPLSSFTRITSKTHRKENSKVLSFSPIPNSKN